MFPEDSQIKKALVSLAIEQALLEVGHGTLDKVGNMLYKEYQAYFADCFEHPEYLNKVLKSLYGNCYQTIVNSIRKKLQEQESSSRFEEFLVKLSE